MLTLRCILLVVLATSRGVFVGIEQPTSSIITEYGPLKKLQKLLQLGGLWFHTRFWMGLYGSRSLKPSQSFGTAVFLAGLKNRLTKLKRQKGKWTSKGIVKKSKRADGSIAVSSTQLLFFV